LTAQTQSNKRCQIVVLDPSTGIFNSNAVNSPSDNSNNDFDPAQIAGTGLLNNNIREIVTTGFNVTVMAKVKIF
jgi:hypothetical protein